MLGGHQGWSGRVRKISSPTGIRSMNRPTNSESLYLLRYPGPLYTGYTQKNGADSKVNKKFISHLTGAQLTPSAAATVQVSHALTAVRFSCLLRGRGSSFQDGVAARKVGASFLNRARNSRCTVITDLDTSKRSSQKAFSGCDAILETGSAAPQ